MPPLPCARQVPVLLGRQGLAALGAVIAVAAATAVSGTAVAAPGCESVQRSKLSNGIEVVLQPDRSLPAVAVLSSVHAGSRDDPPGLEGLAHYVEHLTFRSSPPFTGVKELYQRMGAVESNATTSLDTTQYHAVVPSVQLEQALWVEARRLALGLDMVEDKPAADERQVLLREHTLRNEKNTGLRRFQAISDALFPDGHPYRFPPPSIQGIGRLTLADARWFFGRYYRPERVRVVLVGDFDPDHARQLLERWFGTLRPRTALRTTSIGEPSDTTAEAECSWVSQAPRRFHSRIVLKTRNENQSLSFIWPLPASQDLQRCRFLLNAFTRELDDTLQQLGKGRASLRLHQAELGNDCTLSIDVMPGAAVSGVEPLVRKLYAERMQQVSDRAELVVERQALETNDRISQTSLLSRARELEWRRCEPLQCPSPDTMAAPPSAAELSRFDPDKALIVEQHFERGASWEGDVELVP